MVRQAASRHPCLGVQKHVVQAWVLPPMQRTSCRSVCNSHTQAQVPAGGLPWPQHQAARIPAHSWAHASGAHAGGCWTRCWRWSPVSAEGRSSTAPSCAPPPWCAGLLCQTHCSALQSCQLAYTFLQHPHRAAAQCCPYQLLLWRPQRAPRHALPDSDWLPSADAGGPGPVCLRRGL